MQKSNTEQVSQQIMPIRESIDRASEKQSNFFANAEHQAMLFGEGLISGALLNPINGISQIINNTADTHLPKIEFSNQKEVESSNAGMVGEVAGTLAGFVLTDGAFTAVAGLKASTTMSMAASGAIQAGVFTPSDSSKTGSAFFVDRAENAAINAISMVGMTKTAQVLARKSIFPTFTHRVVSGAIAGAIGGELNYVSTLAFKEDQHFTEEGLNNALAKGALFGAGFGAATSMFEIAAMNASRPAKIHPAQPVLDIRLTGPISKEMQQSLAAGIGDLPAKIQSLLANSGTRIVSGERLTSISPSLKSSKFDYDAIQGGYSPNKGILVSEKTAVTPGVEVAHPEYARYVFRHEAGHAVDELLGRPSHARSFRKAHQADVSEMPEHISAMLDHYVQPKNPKLGASEAFAEVFAVLNGGARTLKNTEAVQQYFPRTTELVERRLAAIPEVKTVIEPQINFHSPR